MTSPGRMTEDETYLDEPYLSIKWRSVPRMLYAEWKGYATSAELRAALLKGVEAMRDRHVRAYVSDARRAKVMLPEDEVWAREVWMPQAVAAGLKRMAVVTAASGMAKVIFEDVSRHVDHHGLEMRTFDSVTAATTWALSGLSGR